VPECGRPVALDQRDLGLDSDDMRGFALISVVTGHLAHSIEESGPVRRCGVRPEDPDTYTARASALPYPSFRRRAGPQWGATMSLPGDVTARPCDLEPG